MDEQDVVDEKLINLSRDKVNGVCQDCSQKCKQSEKVTVCYCPNKINKRRK